MIARILAIAGSDSGGGAGIQADIKTITMLGGHAMTAVTAVTAQNTRHVLRILPVPADLVVDQIEAVIGDIGVDAIKIGMIGGAETARVVADALAGLRCPIICDPVMVASSGDALADEEAVAALGALFRVSTLLTPNVPELSVLTGMKVADEARLEEAAQILAERYGVEVLAKGGHLDGDTVIDLLVDRNGTQRRWSDVRIRSRHDHGTGCTLSSAVATLLGRGQPLAEAIEQARHYVRAALEAAPGLGSGHGPMGHGLNRAHFQVSNNLPLDGAA